MPKPCQCNRWGTGTCAPSQSKEPQTKEMNNKLEQMIAERNKLNTLWITPNDPKRTQEKAPQTNGNILYKS